MKRFNLQLEALSGRDMPSAGFAFDVLGGSEPVADIQRDGGLAGGIEGGLEVDVAGGLRGGVVLGGLTGGVVGSGGLNGGVVLGGLTGGVVGSGGLNGGVVLGGAAGGVVLGSPDDLFAPINVDGTVETNARSVGEEIPSFQAPELAKGSKGEEIPSFMTAGRIGEEIPT